MSLLDDLLDLFDMPGGDGGRAPHAFFLPRLLLAGHGGFFLYKDGRCYRVVVYITTNRPVAVYAYDTVDVDRGDVLPC